MKKTIRTFFLLTVFQPAFGYHLGDISFIFADEALLKEIGVSVSVDKKSVEEKAKLKERIELVISILEQEKELSKSPVKVTFDKKKKQIVSSALDSWTTCSDFSYSIVCLEDGEALQMAVFISSYLNRDSKKNEYGRIVLKNITDLQDEDALDVASLTKKLNTLKN